MTRMTRLTFGARRSQPVVRITAAGLIVLGLALLPARHVAGYPRSICPREYLGQIGDVHWYEGWKGVLNNDCGGLLFEVPHSEAVDVGCDNGTCKNSIEYERHDTTDTKAQTRYCKQRPEDDPFSRNRGQRDVRHEELGIVVVTEQSTGSGRRFYFRILKVERLGRGNYIGLQIDPASAPANARPADWHEDSKTSKTKYVHEIEYDVPDDARYKFVVTTKDEVQW